MTIDKEEPLEFLVPDPKNKLTLQHLGYKKKRSGTDGTVLEELEAALHLFAKCYRPALQFMQLHPLPQFPCDLNEEYWEDQEGWPVSKILGKPLVDAQSAKQCCELLDDINRQTGKFAKQYLRYLAGERLNIVRLYFCGTCVHMHIDSSSMTKTRKGCSCTCVHTGSNICYCVAVAHSVYPI